MTYRTVAALVASASFVALVGTSDQATARPGGAPGAPAVAGFAGGVRPIARGPIARPFRHHHRGNFGGGYWPTVGGIYDSGAYGGGGGSAPVIDVGQPNNVHYTYTYDVPWDWAHRYPPAVAPSDRAYAPSCTTEAVIVPGRAGEHTVNVTRCY